ncbi:MAG TPA: hypothetical protein DD438_02615, partial [Verrucomicrobiales bacterium]|nr:hypothetical protein [Verrucomicrobiales bacterium]
MGISPGDLIRHVVTGAVVVAIAIVALKAWNKHKMEKQIVSDLRDLAHPTTSFEAAYDAEATSSLFKSMALLHKIKAELNKEPNEILREVFHGDDEGALFGEMESGSNASSDPKAELIGKGLLRNYQHCRTLGIFSDSENLRNLMAGKTPIIKSGPDSNSKATIRFIIDPSVSPGSERIIPNMIISPPDRGEGGKPTDMQISQAKEFVRALYDARVIERDTGERLNQHYESF